MKLQAIDLVLPQAWPTLSPSVTVVKYLVLVGDNPELISPEAAVAVRCSVGPIQTSNEKLALLLNRYGHWQANIALYRVAIAHIRDGERTKVHATERDDRTLHPDAEGAVRASSPLRDHPMPCASSATGLPSKTTPAPIRPLPCESLSRHSY